MIFFSLNLLKLFQYYLEIQSIFILSPPYFHLISIHSPFIVRLLFVLCSFARAARTVFCSLQSHCRATVEPLKDHSLFVFCSFILRSLFVSLFVTTLSLLGRSLRIGEYVTGERIFCSFIFYCRATLARTARTCPCGSHRFCHSSFLYHPLPLTINH